MGRCQGGFCGIGVLNHLARDIGLAPARVTKKGEGSYQVVESRRGRMADSREAMTSPEKERR
jgi:hypothetical protein